MNTMMEHNGRRMTPARARAGIAALGALLIAVAPALAGASDHARRTHHGRAQLFASHGLAPELRHGGPGSARVLITLRANPLARAANRPATRVALAGRLGTRTQQAIRRSPQAGRQVAYHATRKRNGALADLKVPATATQRSQRSLTVAVRHAGGHIITVNLLTNSITAIVPSSRLATLAARRDVQSISPAPVRRPMGLVDSATAVGAPSFWSAGYTGGAGTSDAGPVDLAIEQDKIQEDHPAFAGILFQRPPGVDVGTSCGSGPGSCDHGTAVASMAISRGASGCAQCVADDANQKGTAPGLHSVLDADTDGNLMPSGFDLFSWELGLPSGTTPGATFPAQVISDSHGANTSDDDNSSIQGDDALVSEYGGLRAEPAGNSGPTAETLTDSCKAYDTLCMGAFDMGTAPSDPSDDTIASFSSIGPSPLGRKKPDLVGVGITTYAERRWWINGLWNGTLTGTSFAAPQGAAAAALLAGSGVSDPLEQKAILIDAARPGRSSASSAMGTQTGWQPDWGWGELDLGAALAQRTSFATGNVPGNSARFYRATTTVAGDRATLVWNRRGTMCRQPGCQANTLTLTDLDLEQLDPTSGAVEAQSNSTIDNVEQVRSPGTGPVIYKVKAASNVVGLTAEPFALAATNGLTPLATPQPTISVTSTARELRSGQTATITATAQNPSPDLTSESAQLTIDLPPGLTLVSGTPTEPLGTLSEHGQAGDTATRSWTVRATSDVSSQITVTATASRYGETFSSQSATPIMVDTTRPVATLAAPTGTTPNPMLGLSWGATDAGSGVASYDIQVSVDGGPFWAWLMGTTRKAATYPGNAGHRYRFLVEAVDAVGNRSTAVVSSEVSVASAPTPPPPGGSTPTSPPKPKPGLALRSAKLTAMTLAVSGRLSPHARGVVTLIYVVKVGRKTYRATKRVRPRKGRFSVKLNLPRAARRTHKGKLTITYAGDARYAPSTTRSIVKRGQR